VLEMEIGSELMWNWANTSRRKQEQVRKRDYSKERFWTRVKRQNLAIISLLT